MYESKPDEKKGERQRNEYSGRCLSAAFMKNNASSSARHQRLLAMNDPKRTIRETAAPKRMPH